LGGDGKGGWTDQGDNDMRYFLVNHTGKVGGMDVARQAFPTEVKLQGVSFRLIDPKANGGRAVLTFRGQRRDPSAMDEVHNIPAGDVKADRLWFLHTATGTSGVSDGTEIAR
jgi:beta-galactosidase